MPRPAENWEKDRVDCFISIMEKNGFRCWVNEGDNDYTWTICFEKAACDGTLRRGFALGVYLEPQLLASIHLNQFERINSARLAKPVPLMDAVR